jgi:4-hydroxy-tetrahydrodipicolinate reductase
MAKKKVLVCGCSGQMGEIVCRLIDKSYDFFVRYGIDEKDKRLPFETVPECDKKNFTICNSLEEDYVMEDLPDVIIDFSSPDATMSLLRSAIKLSVPIVIATTGFSAEQEEKILEASECIPIFKSANMDPNLTLLKNTIQILAPHLADCDIEILETHHNRKKDAPSGTALMLADAIKEALEDGDKKIVYGRTGKRKNNEIGISSMRGGNIVGEHTIFFYSKHQTIELKHTAYSREGFAEGAIMAARYLVEQKNPGLYTMDDLINL